MNAPDTALGSDLEAQDVRHVDVRGRRLAVQVRGTGPTVLLEMGGGFGGIGPYWCVDEALATFCRVITYDRAGLGRSDHIDGYPTMAERAQDLAALLDALDIHEPALFAGWSLGGLIVENFAARYPERVGALLLIDPTPPDMFEHLGPFGRWAYAAAIGASSRIPLLLARMGVFKTRLGRNLPRKLAAAQFGPHMPSAYADLVAAEMAQPSAYGGMILETGRLLDSCSETNQLLTARGLPQVPAILLAATHRPRASEKMRASVLFKRPRELLPKMEMRELPETGHFIPPEAPDNVIQAVRDLLSQMAVGRLRNVDANEVT